MEFRCRSLQTLSMSVVWMFECRRACRNRRAGRTRRAGRIRRDVSDFVVLVYIPYCCSLVFWCQINFAVPGVCFNTISIRALIYLSVQFGRASRGLLNGSSLPRRWITSSVSRNIPRLGRLAPSGRPTFSKVKLSITRQTFSSSIDQCFVVFGFVVTELFSCACRRLVSYKVRELASIPELEEMVEPLSVYRRAR